MNWAMEEIIATLKLIQSKAAESGNAPDLSEELACQFYDLVEDLGHLIKAIEEQGA